ncbi:MAG: zinc-binding dehydrogenase [Propionibacteriaceae bacterium]|jgi:threonine dehydrogenase-like Zn-dependent dehydrogenase|nr:zinc-binding dehydrogenase [Propionibacteriaceae bacterium]
MRGFGMRSVNDVGWLEKERPACGPLDAIIRPTIIAPCSSDVHVAHGGSGPRTDRILGHEAVGIVDEVGEHVHRFKPGDLVAVPCVTPNWLSRGVQNFRSFSHDRGPFGSFKLVGQKDGVMAEYFHVNQADPNLAFIPDDVAPEAALMTVDMMSTGFHGVELADIGFGERVVVIGIGPVGLMSIASAALRGASQIIAVGTRPKAIEVAFEYGASTVISYKSGPLDQQVWDLTEGKGAHKVVVAGGDAETFAEAVRMTRPNGVIANVNFLDINDHIAIAPLDWGLGMSDKDIRGSFCPGGGKRIQRLIHMIEYHRIDPTKLITHRFHGFDQIPAAFQLMEDKSPDLIKPVVYID